MFRQLSELPNETGIVFGFPGHPYLAVAVDRAKTGRDRVIVLSAANPASAKTLKATGLRIAQVETTKQFNDEIVPAIRKMDDDDKPDAIVFHGLGEYAQIVLGGLTKGTPQQQEWGEMIRIVTNDLRLLTAVCPVLYVTCDVMSGLDEKKQPFTDLNINPGLKKSILGDLAFKLYVTDNPQGGDPLVQENPAQSLAFVRGRSNAPVSDAIAGGLGQKPAVRTLK